MIDFLGAFPIVGMKRRTGSDDAVPNWGSDGET